MGARSQRWATPWALFREIERRHAFGSRFTLDAAAEEGNAKCDRFFTPDDDALAQHAWSLPLPAPPAVVWLNPPYDDIERWMRRAIAEVERDDLFCEQVVMLVPARTSTDWYHQLAPRAMRIEAIRGRVHFVPPPDEAATQPFEHSLIISFERAWSFSAVAER